MNKSKTVLGLAGAFVIGCAASQLVSNAIPPARAGTAPQRWEYVCNTIDSRRDHERMTEQANAYGRAGWEMTAVASDNGLSSWCFKRPLP
jgi:hypothetical protein